MTSMLTHLPRSVQRLLTREGIEGDSILNQNGHMTIIFDDLEVAFEVREATLDFHPCCLINHEGMPALLIHNLLNQDNQ